MAAKTHHFRVDNGDMALLVLESGARILVDINIRGAADDEDDDTPNVSGQLRDILENLDRDDAGRLYVDAFLLTHPDEDHCRGLKTHFHLGAPESWSKTNDKIFVREMWSSPIVFRRRDKHHKLCVDANAWASEARRRVGLFKENGLGGHGDRVLILGEDVNGKTDDLEDILVRAGETVSRIAGSYDYSGEALLIAPIGPNESEEQEELVTKNNSSVVMRFKLGAGGDDDAARFLFGGDAEVGIWERIRGRTDDDDLTYDVLIAPHHCSWHSLSWDSWSKNGEDAEVSDDARSALAQARKGATILASSKTIQDDDIDPPCVRAKREYVEILKSAKGTFKCIADVKGTDPVVFEIDKDGPSMKAVKAAAIVGTTTGLGREAYAHG